MDRGLQLLSVAVRVVQAVTGPRAGAAAAALACALLAGPTLAQLEVTVRDHRDRPVDHAVVTAHRLEGPDVAPMDEAVMDQIDESFVPHVLVVPRGTPVQFPNHDDVRHHVYSFSDAKNFELPLYEGTPASPVVFDRAGVVALGCNIHDWMEGYVYVVETPHHAVAESGSARIDGLPPGEYRVEVWHPRMRAKENWSRQVALDGGSPTVLEVEMRLKPALKIRRAPKPGDTEY